MPNGLLLPGGIEAPQALSTTHCASVTVTAKFRKFDSIAQAFDEHGRLLATGLPYRNAMRLVNDPEAFADALTGVYATDPKYGFTLNWVIQNYGFARYDR